MSGLSAKYVVLGLLIEQPGYGYDLIKRTRSRFGFLGLSENFVYRVLDRLEEDGFIEERGDKKTGQTRRGAARLMYRVTASGRNAFKEWLAMPSERAVLRDELRAKLDLSAPGDLPALLAVVELQSRECVADLAAFQRPVLVHVAEPEVPWHHAAVMMIDDLHLRFLQALADWLDAIGELIEERIERMSDTAASSS